MLAQRGATRRARRILMNAWRAAPHPLLAEAWRTLSPDVTAMERLKDAQRLAQQNPEHEESRIALARAALEARLWGEARRHLDPLVVGKEDDAAPRVCRLMAKIEESEKDDQRAARAWLARAGETVAPDPAWLCDQCGAESALWSATCPSCRGFATLHWRAVVGPAAPPHLAAPADIAAKLLAWRR
jgi:HemY protein